MVAASQKLLSLVGVANLATRAASSRPYRCGRKPGAGEGSAADRDATNLVPIHWFPNPPGDDTTQKPVEKKMAVPTDNDAEAPAARAQIRNNNE